MTEQEDLLRRHKKHIGIIAKFVIASIIVLLCLAAFYIVYYYHHFKN